LQLPTTTTSVRWTMTLVRRLHAAGAARQLQFQLFLDVDVVGRAGRARWSDSAVRPLATAGA